MKLDYVINTYPNFPEYKLVDLYPVEKIYYKRGNDFSNLFSEDFSMWQDFFCNQYEPPEGKDIVLFHCCSWSKPYDFSFIVNPIRKISGKYTEVHRVILSNVGVVPYEYQMNPTFCCYDCPPLIDTTNMGDSEIISLRKKILEVNYQRIYKYLSSHINRYKMVITLSLPIKYGSSHLISLVCKELKIPYQNVISKELYSKYKNKIYEDCSEIYIEPEILQALDDTLKNILSLRR